MQIGSTSGPSEFADDRGNDLATLKKNIKELGSRSLRRTMAKINAGASSATGSSADYVRQSVSPGKARIDAEMCSNARLAVEAQISTNKMQAWEIELRRLELRIDAAVKRQKSHLLIWNY